MFSWSVVFAVSLLNILSDSPASSCVTNCTDPPVFTPSSLVVKHGDPTSASCSVCQTDVCIGSRFGLEASVGEKRTNGTMISWEVGRLTEWEMNLMCYYNNDVNDVQCCTTLPLTVYKPPDSVSISFQNHTGPMSEGHQYTLLCTVHGVAPVKNLTVTFYRGNKVLGQKQSSSNTQIKPVNETYTLNVNISKDDDGAQYWCAAQLELGPEGPQPPPVVKSKSMDITVYYKPQLKASSHPNVTVTVGDSLSLNCSAVGNPPPSYIWTLPSSNHPQPDDSSILTIQSVSHEDAGTFTCSVSNGMGEVDVSFNVKVRTNYIPYIIAAILVAAVFIVIIVVLIYIYYYKRNKMGQYNMKDVFRLSKKLIPETNA